MDTQKQAQKPNQTPAPKQPREQREPKEKREAPQLTWGIGDGKFLESLQDASIDVCFHDSKVLTGRLRGNSRYNLTMELADGQLVLVSKNFIKYIKQSNGKPKEAESK